jgi:hypothetical protein
VIVLGLLRLQIQVLEKRRENNQNLLDYLLSLSFISCTGAFSATSFLFYSRKKEGGKLFDFNLFVLS